MANWPRSIRPEDRIKYLIQARADLVVEWEHSPTDLGLVMTVTEKNERCWVDSNEGSYEAWYASDHQPEFLVGEFDNAFEARKALLDHVVVIWAVDQAWEDVAS